MSELIAVHTAFSYIDENLISSLKRDALLVDRIAIPVLERFLSTAPPTRHEHNFRELQWLSEEGLVFEAPSVFDLSGASEQHFLHTQLKRHTQLWHELLIAKESYKRVKKSLKQETFLTLVPLLGEYTVLTARLAAIHLRLTEHLDAYAWSSTDLEETDSDEMDNVLTVVLNNLPIPDEQTSWEQIFEFRSDPDSTRKFLAIKNWMRDIAKLNLPLREIEDKLEFLIAEYEHHMRIHKLKTKQGTLESLIVTPAEVLEDLIKLRWGSVGKKLFTLRQQTIALMEAEASSPGREVAFIVGAQQRFK